MEAPVLHTLFELCNDVRRMRSFYSDAIGLTETFFDAEKGWLTYQAGPVQVVFTEPRSGPSPPLAAWSRSPGWDGGSIDSPSWVFRVAPTAYERMLARLQDSGAPVQTRTSDDRDLRQAFAMDPMGRTVEIYCEREDASEAAR